MARRQDEGHEVDRIEPLGPAEDAGREVVEPPGWAGAAGARALQGPAGDLDRGASGYSGFSRPRDAERPWEARSGGGGFREDGEAFGLRPGLRAVDGRMGALDGKEGSLDG